MGAFDIIFQGNVLPRLLGGLAVTLRISALSVVLSIPFGVAMGGLMVQGTRPVRAVLRTYLDFVRVMPQLVLLYLVFFGSAIAWNVNFSGEVASVIAFTLWGAAELGDLVRGALESIPRSQYESAHVLGLTETQAFLRVILPQALRRLLPPTVNLVTRVIKTTSLCMLISVVELVRVGQQVIDLNRFEFPLGALAVYATIGIMFFAVCWPLSVLSRCLERGLDV